MSRLTASPIATPGPMKIWDDSANPIYKVPEGEEPLNFAVSAPPEGGFHRIVAVFKHRPDAALFAASPELAAACLRAFRAATLQYEQQYPKDDDGNSTAPPDALRTSIECGSVPVGYGWAADCLRACKAAGVLR